MGHRPDTARRTSSPVRRPPARVQVDANSYTVDGDALTIGDSAFRYSVTGDAFTMEPISHPVDT